jgi:hypothetical protein
MRNLETKIIKRLLNEFRMPEKELDVKLNKLSPAEVSKALDDAIGNKHVNGKPYPKWLMSIKENAIDKISLTDMPFETFLKSNFQKMSINQDLISIWRSFYLFTSASVATIRDPSKYNASVVFNFKKEYEHIEAKENTKDFYFKKLIDFTPTQQDYENAKAILMYAASSNVSKGTTLYRGIALPDEVCTSLVKGIQFQNWPISSWTIEEYVAIEFAKNTSALSSVSSKDRKQFVLITIYNCNYGCGVGTATRYISEKEVIMGKKLEIVSVNDLRRSEGMYHVECKVIN